MDLWDILSMQASAISSFLKSACQPDTGSWLEMMRATKTSSTPSYSLPRHNSE